MPGLLADDTLPEPLLQLMDNEEKETSTLPTELRVAHNEYEWLVGTQTMHTLERIDAIARECCRRLPLPSMLGKYGAAGAKTSINHPEKFTLVGAGASESTTNAATAIRATLTLMGDNVVQADVAIRYTKAPGHMFRAVAQPHVQWKLQQIQDAANYIAKTSEDARNALQQLRRQSTSDATETEAIKWRRTRTRGELMLAHLKTIIADITEARDALMLPKKRSLAELREHTSNTCFSPALPPDLTLSFYAAGAKLMCAAYHVHSSTGSDGGAQFVVVQAECTVPWLHNVLTQLSTALRDAQHMYDKLSMADESVDPLP